jgi:ABC-type cobalamin/Fe3+-siderophores transport system ATPase subunit
LVGLAAALTWSELWRPLAAIDLPGLIVLANGRVHAEGAWTEVVTPPNLEAVYGVSAVVGVEQACRT